MDTPSTERELTADDSPLVVGFMAASEKHEALEAAAQRLGFRLAWLANPQPLEALKKPGTGAALSSGTALLEWVTSLRPALIVLDLENPGIPWQTWIHLLKADPSTRRIPLVCLDNLAGGREREAKALGADQILAGSLFLQDPAEVLAKLARPAPLAAYQASCREALSPAAIHGLELFNRGEYFEAHEALEAAWNAESSPGRELYRALLQVAVAYLQIERGNYQGAVKMFLRLRQWLAPFPDLCRGVNLHRLRREVQEAYQRVLELGPERITAFERELFRPIYFDTAQDKEN